VFIEKFPVAPDIGGRIVRSSQAPGEVGASRVSEKPADTLSRLFTYVDAFHVHDSTLFLLPKSPL
jgi:hypothetical protein